MLTVKLTDLQLEEIEESLKRDLIVMPSGQKWQVRERVGATLIANVEDELEAFILRDCMVSSAMEILRRANRPRISFGGDPA